MAKQIEIQKQEVCRLNLHLIRELEVEISCVEIRAKDKVKHLKRRIKFLKNVK